MYLVGKHGLNQVREIHGLVQFADSQLRDRSKEWDLEWPVILSMATKSDRRFSRGYLPVRR